MNYYIRKFNCATTFTFVSIYLGVMGTSNQALADWSISNLTGASCADADGDSAALACKLADPGDAECIPLAKKMIGAYLPIYLPAIEQAVACANKIAATPNDEKDSCKIDKYTRSGEGVDTYKAQGYSAACANAASLAVRLEARKLLRAALGGVTQNNPDGLECDQVGHVAINSPKWQVLSYPIIYKNSVEYETEKPAADKNAAPALHCTNGQKSVPVPLLVCKTKEKKTATLRYPLMWVSITGIVSPDSVDTAVSYNQTITGNIEVTFVSAGIKAN